MTTTPAERVRGGLLKAVVGGVVATRYVQGDPIARLVAPAGRANPYPIYARVREERPLVPSMMGLMTGRHELCAEVLRDHERFGSAPVPRPDRPLTRTEKLISTFSGGLPEQTSRRPEVGQHLSGVVPDPLGTESMIGMDPPDHTRLRRLVSRAFTPRAIERVRARVEEVAAELLDEAPRDGFEFMSGYAGVLPVVVISELLGIPPRDWERVKQWGDVLASGLDVLGGAPPEKVAPALDAFGRYLTDLFEQRRRNPGDRVIDTLIAAADEGDGERLTDRELMATAVLLLVAGFETTVNLLGNGLLALLRHPEQRDALVADPSLAPNAIEEILRFDPSVQMTSRIVRDRTMLGGRPVNRGTMVICLLAGANRDPAVFDDPDRFDITRANAREHLAFAGGVHYCLGASLARLEGAVALRTLFERYPDVALSGRPVPGRGLILRGPRRLPVRLSGPAGAPRPR